MDPGTPLGQLGFYYDDPNRIYVESTRAHNCLEIDHTSYPRRGVPFYGSAIRSAARDSRTGVVATEAAAVHFETIAHDRLLFHRAGEWTLVVDHVGDGEARPHVYTQRLQFGPGLELADADARSLLFRLPTTGEYLEAAALLEADAVAPVRGQTEPELQGFVSRIAGQLIPTWSAGWLVKGVASAVIATLLVILPDRERCGALANVSDDAAAGQVQWQAAGKSHVLWWARADDGRLDFGYREIE
jgi:hypothetical protein